ncbi:hypothetical protein Tco_0694575 [Tanacetum coccineum]
MRPCQPTLGMRKESSFYRVRGLFHFTSPGDVAYNLKTYTILDWQSHCKASTSEDKLAKIVEKLLSDVVCLKVKLELDEWIKDSGCIRYMTGNKSLFHAYEAYDRGFNGLEDSTLGLEGISSSESLSNAHSSYQNFSSRVIAFFPLSILLECSSLV